MFNKNELSMILGSLENNKSTMMLHCIFCDLVDCREEYACAQYCVDNCDFCREIEKVNSLIGKVREAIK